MTKRRGPVTALSWIMLALAMLLASAVSAQDDQVTYTFRVTVGGEPCANATYWALLGIPDSEGYGIQLTDPDGDRVYTGTETFVAGNDVFVSLVQGVGTVSEEPLNTPFPGPPVVTLRDLGRVTVQQDTVVEATAPACQPGLPPTGTDDLMPYVLVVGGLLVVAAGAVLRRNGRMVV